MAAELAPLLSKGLPLAPIHDLANYPDRMATADVMKTFQPRVCFLDFASDVEAASATAADIHHLNSTLPIVALLTGNDSDLILRCLRQGARDFLIRPFTTDQIDAAVEKIARLQPPPGLRSASGGNLIAVMPAKGGSGATTISCSLAHQSKKISKKVLLADLDALTGTVSFLLKLKSSHSFMDVLNRSTTLDDDLWSQLVAPSHGVDVLLSPEHLMQGIDDLADAGPVLEYAQKKYETAILDCGGVYGEWNLSIARYADEILLVTMNDLSSLQASQRALAYFDQNRIDSGKVRPVLNRYDADMGLTPAMIASALQADIFQVIPADPETVQKSLMDGRPIAASSVFGKNVAGILRQTAPQSQPGTATNGKKLNSRGGLLGMFSRASS
ncbi:MAG TPA: AAA family ATPase [Bryobacteraceae bacterium]|nr:AAA family ATPase [Bryobacteraceae bacterium]